ncbi:ABC-three component system middle component 5 [Chryseobacterium sp. 6424]|uniref:ABC-three component system middle component 5 n=1 Tax=Chryseobacterium sp. 6424 TaxID=2039166 RepID=UPI0029373744|nr:ABC-three component system middle component 5 [Chryseobacterium sp. 6424]
MYRIILLSSRIAKTIEIDKLKILDFYYVYPTELLDIKKPVGFKKYEKFLKREKNKYDRINNPKRIFYKMNSIQFQAMKILVAYGYLDSESFENGIVKVTEKSFGEEFQIMVEKSVELNTNLITLLAGPIADIDLYGHLGLKERTGLIEFRYDTI